VRLRVRCDELAKDTRIVDPVSGPEHQDHCLLGIEAWECRHGPSGLIRMAEGCEFHVVTCIGPSDRSLDVERQRGCRTQTMRALPCTTKPESRRANLLTPAPHVARGGVGVPSANHEQGLCDSFPLPHFCSRPLGSRSVLGWLVRQWFRWCPSDSGGKCEWNGRRDHRDWRSCRRNRRLLHGGRWRLRRGLGPDVMKRAKETRAPRGSTRSRRLSSSR